MVDYKSITQLRDISAIRLLAQYNIIIIIKYTLLKSTIVDTYDELILHTTCSVLLTGNGYLLLLKFTLIKNIYLIKYMYSYCVTIF